MPEPVTVIGLGALAAYLGKDGLQKLLGPTADYLGSSLKDLTQKRMEAVGRIFKNASNKVGDDDDASKSVPPKMLKEVLDDGSFTDEPIGIEYLGGVLASSRTSISRDNRGASIAKLVNSLSNYELRAHYLIYTSVKSLFKDSPNQLSPDDRLRMKLYIPISAFLQSMDFNQEELKSSQKLLSHIFFGLRKNDLIEQDFLFGQPDFLQSSAPGATYPGIVVIPSIMGFDLFLWAFGHGDEDLPFVFDSDFKPTTDGVPFGVTGAILASNLQP